MNDSQLWLNVTSGEQAVTAAIKRFDDECKFFANGYLAAPEKYRWDIVRIDSPHGYVASSFERCLSHQAEYIHRKLLEYCQDAGQPTLRRLVAARQLSLTHESVAIEVVSGVLQDGSSDEKCEAIRELTFMRLEESPSALQKIYQCLAPLVNDDNKDVARDASFTLKTFARVNAEFSIDVRQQAEAVDDLEVRRFVTDQLSTSAKTMDRLSEIEKQITTDRPDLVLDSVCDFLDSDDTTVVQHALKLVGDHFPWDAAAKHAQYSADGMQSAIIAKLANGGPASATLLRHFVSSELNGLYRGTALKALAEAIGDEAIGDIEAALVDSDISMVGAAIEAVGILSKNGISKELLKRVRAAGESHRQSGWLQSELTKMLVRIDALEAFELFAKDVDCGQFQVKPRDTDIERPMSDLLDCLRELGIGKPITWDDLADAVRSDVMASGISEINKWVYFALEQAGVLVLLDMTPGGWLGYDVAFEQFASCTSGDLEIQAAMDDRPHPDVNEDGTFHIEDPWSYDDEDEDDVDQPVATNVKTQFVANGRVYEMIARGNDFWFDLTRFLSTINQTLADASIDKRFVGFQTGSSTAACIYGVPTAIEKLANEFHWPICHDPDVLIDEAKEFRRKLDESSWSDES